MRVFPAPKEKAQRTNDDEPMFHIYERDSTTALCGHPMRDGATEYPFHRGIHDCEKCWSIFEEWGRG